jgi:TDG/mug DNA glycosylase family protein
MSRVYSFEPIEDSNAKVLILGSMPGRASLAAGQYYAHSQNAFWRIISQLIQFDLASPYEMRVQALKSAKIALWDVLQSCRREGSLDAMIERDTQVANDFKTFLQTHKKITHIFFNGTKAEHYFMRHVLRDIDSGSISFSRLPSTSPAHAAMSFAQKLSAWRIILKHT